MRPRVRSAASGVARGARRAGADVVRLARGHAGAGASRPRRRPSATAEINAIERAAETHHASATRLLDDPFARLFVQRRPYRALCAEPRLARAVIHAFDRVYAGNHAHVILRNRLHEDELARALAGGFDQVVLLGAGYDSSAFRLDLGTATLFEVDTPYTQGAKIDAIERAGLEPRGRVVYVACDFETDSPADRLAARGFDPARRALVVWWGVTPYLTETAVRATLAQVAGFSAPGSRLLVDYVDASVTAGTTACAGARRAARSVARRGEPLRFGLTRDRAAALLAEGGFAVVESLRVPDLAARYAPPGGVWCRTDDWFGALVAERVGD